MNGVAEFSGMERASWPAQPLHLAIGIFDGLHLGHQAVIEAAVQSARRSGGIAAVLTFSPHPSAVLRPDQRTRLLLPPEARTHVLKRLGVDAIVVQTFTPEFARMAASEFLPWLKQHAPRLAGVYVGDNWRFGRGRDGDVAFLVGEGKKHAIHVFSAPRVNLDGEPISSTRVRRLLEEGDIAGANALLGYSYFALGRVEEGKRLGRTIGFPTLNLAWAPELAPRFGVYVVRISGPKAPAGLPGVANYGLRPTVENATAPRLETHVLTDCPFGAGDEIVVDWIRFLRPEKKFSSVAELTAQIARDRDEARADFSLR